jgi:SAM-dependent methyltransferase
MQKGHLLEVSQNHSFIVDLASCYRPPPGRLLDFGCGTAEMAALALDRGYDAYGVDVFSGVGGSSENLAIATSKIGTRALAIAPNEATPFGGGFFDLVISNQVFEHVSNLHGVTEEIARITRPGGILLALMPTSEVLWETHLGLPWVHRLPTGSRQQRILLKAFRRIGLGRPRYLPDSEWMSRAATILREEVFHRSVGEYVSCLDKSFRLVAEEEPAWARYRIERHRVFRHGSPTLGLRSFDGLLRQAVRRAAGAVLVFERLDVAAPNLKSISGRRPASSVRLCA